MRIRLATLTDVNAIMQLIAKVVPVMNASGNFQWDKTYPGTQVFEHDIALSQLWVAELNGSIAGIIAITTQQEPEYAQVGWDINEAAIVIHRLAVDPQFQGKGIAKALLAQAENEAYKRAIPVIRVDTNSANQATKLLFPKLGYSFYGETALAFRPGLRFYCYQKTLILNS